MPRQESAPVWNISTGVLVGCSVWWVAGVISLSAVVLFIFPLRGEPTEMRRVEFDKLPLTFLYGIPWAVAGGGTGGIVSLARTKTGAYSVALLSFIGMLTGVIATILSNPPDGWLFLTVPFNAAAGTFF